MVKKTLKKEMNIKLIVIALLSFFFLAILLRGLSANKIEIYGQNEGNLVKIKAKTRGRVAFARVSFVFDPDKIRLDSEIRTNVNYSTVIEKTNAAKANEFGKGVIVIALSPFDNAPLGEYVLAEFDTRPGQKSSLGSLAEINFVPGDMQFVDKRVKQLNIGTRDVEISL